MSMLQEFKPTIFFLLKFVGIYIVGNLAYGLYVSSYSPRVDPLTQEVTEQTASCLQITGWEVEVENRSSKPTTYIEFNDQSIVSVYEGCNGVNTMIIFVAFIISLGHLNKRMLWFIPLGLVLIHMANLARIGLLFLVTIKLPNYVYFTHKYLFTAIIYGVVFVLWLWWVRSFVTFKR
jgi:exosortase family protein XrtF